MTEGIAVADIDDDGMDEIYLCQPGGLPNRLYKIRAECHDTDVVCGWLQRRMDKFAQVVGKNCVHLARGDFGHGDFCVGDYTARGVGNRAGESCEIALRQSCARGNQDEQGHS